MFQVVIQFGAILAVVLLYWNKIFPITTKKEKAIKKTGILSYLDKNISVAVCGSSLSSAQVKELLSLDVREIVIAFDRQYKEYKDEECMKWHDKINKIVWKYKDYVKMSVIFDEDHLLGYKDSPTDRGKEVFEKLYKNRINLYI